LRTSTPWLAPAPPNRRHRGPKLGGPPLGSASRAREAHKEHKRTVSAAEFGDRLSTTA
jgi:hypothetical protein